MITEVDSNDCSTSTCLLLDLVATVGSGVADDELQLLTSVVHKLSLEGPFLGLGGPRDPLVDIEEPIQTHWQGNQTPAHCLPDLHTKKTSGVTDPTVFFFFLFFFGAWHIIYLLSVTNFLMLSWEAMARLCSVKYSYVFSIELIIGLLKMWQKLLDHKYTYSNSNYYFFFVHVISSKLQSSFKVLHLDQELLSCTAASQLMLM